MSDATLTEENLDQNDTAEEAYTGPSCEKCGLPTNAAACPRCGWYPSLGIHVEIDEAFEAVMNASAAPAGAEGDEPAAPKQPEWAKHVAVWRDLIPGWGWLMIGTTLGIVAAAVVVRVVTASNSTLHMWCGVIGLAVGLFVALTMHVIGFVLCSSDNADFGVADIIIKPFKTWKQLLSELPERLWLANSANAGLSTALCAAAIVGGIPYERLLDWGFKAPPKQNLVGAIAQQAAQTGGGEDDLEGAMSDFADKAAGDLEGAAAEPTPPVEKPREKLECLIIGFQAGSDGRIDGFLLASDVNGKLKYVGRVVPTLDRDVERNLLKKFEKNVSTRPFVKTSQSGTWLRPRFTCRVTYTEWPKGSRPKELEWDELLDEVKLPW